MARRLMAAAAAAAALSAVATVSPAQAQTQTKAAAASGASSSSAELAQVKALLEQLMVRVQTLEKRNHELEHALETERLSEHEPEVATRLKALEARTQHMGGTLKRMEALDGIEVHGDITAVAQGVNAGATPLGHSERRLNYRGDINITAPAGKWGDVTGKAFADIRLGQGTGPSSLPPTYTSSVNTVGFQVDGVNNADSSFAILAQGWYQLDIPLPRQRSTSSSTQHARLTVGKIDVFGFFDGNAIADDETRRFQNNVFVHNPLLDSGGSTGADAYGFAPGVIVQYIDEENKSTPWTYSLGAFASGQGANFSGSLGQPLVIAQIETAQRIGYLPGNYRLYAWTNGRANGYDALPKRRSGVGVSLNQQVSDEVTLFARWGRLSQGDARFNNALTLGGEWGGNSWGRGRDALGAAWGRLKTSSAFAAHSSTVDANGDGIPDWGYSASGAETLAELYYRWDAGNGLQLTPNVQSIRRPGGDGSASTIYVVGLRAHWSF